MDRFGVKRGLPLAVLLWSVAAAAHGLCSLVPHSQTVTLSLAWLSLGSLAIPATAAGFMTARIALGLAEGGNFPGAIKTVAEWFPVKERALATGIFNAGTNIGAILCPVIVPRMITSLGWPSTFYLTGGLGLFWLAAWWWLYDNPEKHRRLSEAERAYIRAGQPAVVEQKVSVPWLSLLGYRAVWAYIAAGILAAPVWNIYMFFLPDFLQKNFQLDLVAVGDWTGVFYFLASFGGVAGGWLSGRLLGRGWSVNAARKVTLLSCAIAVVPIFLAPSMPNVLLTVIVVGLAGSAHQGWSANLYSFVSDTMPRQAISSVVGLGGFVAYFTGGLMTEAIGVILQKTGSYASIFAAASLMYLLSLLILHLLVPRIAAAPATGGAA
jgi:ACS family hexuronate transporter-like MFS transporter